MTLRLPSPWLQALNANGFPIPGAKLYCYAAGTSTPQATYSDAALTVPNANPVVADSGGFFPDIFLGASAYKVVLTDAAGVTLRTVDPVPGDSASTTTAASASAVNLLPNPQGQVFQRIGTSVWSDGAYSVDGCVALIQAAVPLGVIALGTPEQGQPTCFRLTQSGSAAATRIGASLPIPSDDCRHLRGAAVVAAGRLRCSVSTKINYALLEWTGTADNMTADPVADWTSASLTAGGFFSATSTVVLSVGTITPAANTWTDLPAITGTCSSGLNNLRLIVWTDSAVAQNVTLDIGKLRVAAGSADPGYTPRPYADDYQRCVRTLYVAPIHILTTAAGAGSYGADAVRFPCRMAKVPASSSGGSIVVNNNNTGIAVDNITQTGARYYTTSSGAGVMGLSMTVVLSAEP